MEFWVRQRSVCGRQHEKLCLIEYTRLGPDRSHFYGDITSIYDSQKSTRRHTDPAVRFKNKLLQRSLASASKKSLKAESTAFERGSHDIHVSREAEVKDE